ncbi:MAG: PEP-CTERM sorting domain-containing protein, partial [Crocosphaera sp.]
SNFLEPGQLAYQSGGNPANIATSIVRWDGDQDPFDFDLNFELGGFDATGMGMNNSFIWVGFNLDVADGGGSTFLKMRAYSGDNANSSASELILELNEDTVSDLLIFNFADFSELNVDGGLADFTALTAIEYEIMAPGTTDVSLDLLESGFSVNPSGPANVPEPGTVMAMAALGLTGLLAKRKKVK